MPAKNPDRQRRYETREMRKGARRIPGGMMSGEAVHAMLLLLRHGYAGSKSECIERALIDADKARREEASLPPSPCLDER